LADAPSVSLISILDRSAKGRGKRERAREEEKGEIGRERKKWAVDIDANINGVA